MITHCYRFLIISLFLSVLCLISTVVIADTTINENTTYSDDVLFQDETVIINANISCIENSTISFINCNVHIGIIGSNAPVGIKISNNASLFVRDSNFTKLITGSSYHLSIDTVGSIMIENSTFLNNYGSLQLGVVSIRQASVVIERSLFQGNSGGLILQDIESPMISNVTIISNGAYGIDIYNCSNTTVKDSAFKGFRDGTALDIRSCPGFLVIRSSFTDNYIGIRSSGRTHSLVIRECDFLRNSGYAIRLERGGIVPGPLISNCTFTEDSFGISAQVSGGVNTPWAVESLTISDCRFRFVDVGIECVGDDWTVQNNTFSYCLSGISVHYGETIIINGNTFEDSIRNGINIDDYSSNNKMHPIVTDNMFVGGSGFGISISTGGSVVVSLNVFRDLRGGCLFIVKAGIATILNNTFIDSPLGINSWYSKVVIENSRIIQCDVGIRCESGGTINLVNASFSKTGVLVSVEDGIVNLVTGDVIEGGTIDISRSLIMTGPDFSLESVKVSMANDSRAVVEYNPTIESTTWSLDGSSVVDLYNTSPQFEKEFIDSSSVIRVWWPVHVTIGWMSSGLPVEDAEVLMFDRDLSETASSTTDSLGRTNEMDIMGMEITRDSSWDWNPYTISVKYGQYYLEFTCEIIGSLTYDVSLDDVAPVLELYRPDDGEVFGNGSIEIIGGVMDDSDIATMRIIIDGDYTQTIIPVSSWRIYVSLKAGIHDIVIQAEDVWKNYNNLVFSVVVDPDPPFIDIIQPLEGATVTSYYLIVDGTTEPLIDVEVNGVSASSKQDGSFNVTVPLTIEGLQEIIIVTTDKFERSLVKRILITVDWTPPEIHIEGDPSLINTTLPIIKGSVSEPVGILRVMGRDVPVSSSNSFTIGLVLWEGSNDVKWTCRDIAGNVGEGIIHIRVDTELNLTVTKPSVGEEVHRGYIEVSGTTDPLTRIVLREKGQEIISGPDGRFTAVVWSGDRGENSIVVEAIDDAGNNRSIEISFFVVDVEGDGGSESPIYLFLIIIVILIITSVIGLLYVRGRRDGIGD